MNSDNNNNKISILDIQSAIQEIEKNPHIKEEALKFKRMHNSEFKEYFDYYGDKIYTNNIEFYMPDNITEKKDRDNFLKSCILNPLMVFSITEDPIFNKLHVLLKEKDKDKQSPFYMENIPPDEVEMTFYKNIFEFIRFLNLIAECDEEEKVFWKNHFLEKIDDYNRHPQIVQARYYEMSRNKSLPDMAAKGEFPESVIREILDDYGLKSKQRIINNFRLLKSYVDKLNVQKNSYYETKTYLLIKEITNSLENGIEAEEFYQTIISRMKAIDMECPYNFN